MSQKSSWEVFQLFIVKQIRILALFLMVGAVLIVISMLILTVDSAKSELARLFSIGGARLIFMGYPIYVVCSLLWYLVRKSFEEE